MRARWFVAGAGVVLVAGAAAFFGLRGGGEDESARAVSAVREVRLTAAPATVELGDRTVRTWAFNGQVPGPEIRLRAGELLRATVRNELPQRLTIHWHGIALRNDMDGVPGVTQQSIAPGGEFVYEFTPPDPGTYFYHPHTGTQLDTGLYAPLVVEDATEAGAYDREVTLVLDDWIDGIGKTPDEVLERLEGAGSETEGMEGSRSGDMEGMPGMDGEDQESSGMPGMGTGEATEEQMEQGADTEAPGGPLGRDTGDVRYPLYLVNGRSPTDPAVFDVVPGERVRLRLINAASDTPFRVALGNGRLTVLATDGFPVRPVSTDAILIGMGERYDAAVTFSGDGVFPLVAQAEGKGGRALAVLRAGPGMASRPDVQVPGLRGQLLAMEALRATPEVALPLGRPDRTYRLALTGDMAAYRWGMKVAGGGELLAQEGERVRLVLQNRTAMWHPIHLHGQTFQVVGSGGTAGPRKDTVIVPARGRVAIDFIADNPGRWALHCHNVYHAEAGMQTVLTTRPGPKASS